MRFFNRTTLLLLLTDIAVAVCSLGLMLLFRFFLEDWNGSFRTYLVLFVGLIILLPLCFNAQNMYASVAYAPPQEIKRSTYSVSLTFFMLTMFLFLTQIGGVYSRFVVGAAWFVCLFTIPFFRGFVRRRVYRRAWYGRRFVLIGRPGPLRELLDSLTANAVRGYKPVALVFPLAEDADAAKNFPGIPSFSGPGACMFAAAHSPGAYALVALSGFDERMGEATVDTVETLFSSVVLVPSMMGGAASVWVSALDLGEGIGLLVRQNLLSATNMRLKRLCDLALIAVGGLLALPLGLVLAAAIKLDSRGPVFFRQARLGKDGAIIKVFKFRTMYYDKARRIGTYLKASPQLAEEWERDHKLRDDPRITRMGKFLRRTSLDELPQLLNVFKGEMSIVGPRPIVVAEKKKYGDVYTAYTRVLPGITGLWQVSGRNDTGYARRVQLDRFYVSNWSVWMDIWIILRTIPALISRSGAY